MFRQSSWLPIGVCFALLALTLPVSTLAQGICRPDMDGDVAKVFYEPDAIYWDAVVDHDRLVLRVNTPCDIIEKVFKRGETPFFELREVLGPLDGTYTWELRVEPMVDADVRETLREAHETGDYTNVRKLQDEGRLPVGPFVEGEAFSVVEGRILQPTEGEEKSTVARRSSSRALAAPVVAAGADLTSKDGNRLATKDVLHYDDVIVTGSLCVGFDCANGESFGYNTIKLKENNLRLYFEDTSVGTFPTGDWRIATNDTTSGGASYFAVEDVSNTRTPFRVETGAPNHALYVEDYGRVGLGTSIPYVELHIVDGDSPTVRLDQDGSSGWVAQKWDLAGNETNFFIRDVTNGSTLPFRMQPGAPSNSLTIRDDGEVGVGTWSPETQLHVKNSDGSAAIKVQETSGTAADRNLLTLQNNGPPTLLFDNDNAASNGTWTYTVTNGGVFQVNASGSGVPIELQLSEGGDMTIGGTLTESSSRTVKTAFEELDAGEVLGRVVEMPVTAWSYRYDEDGTRHIGPMAEDFFAAFGVGSDDKHIAPSDKAGVALAAIQGLHGMVRERDQRIEELEERLAALEAVLANTLAE